MSGTATMPTVTNSTEVKSPTQLVWDYLSANGKLRGSGPTSADVRAALEANAQNPGLIKGLDNQAPPGLDPAASATSASSGNRNSSNGPISDQSNTSSAPGEAPRGSGEPKTSAPPPGGNVTGSVGDTDYLSSIGTPGLVGSIAPLVAAILGRKPLGAPGVVPGGAPTANAGDTGLPLPAGTPDPQANVPPPEGRVLAGMRDNPVSPAAVALDKATENAPVISGLRPPPDPSLAPGPTAPVAGAEPPVIPLRRPGAPARGAPVRPPAVRLRG